jgi:hypothetical protein
MTQRIVLGVGMVTVLLTACGSAAATGPRASATSSPTVPATASAVPTLSAVGMYPAVDTPLNKAPAAMAAAWEALGIETTIPGNDIFTEAPTMVPVVNQTECVLSNADAQAIGAAIWREDTLIQWAEANDEPAFIAQTLAGPESDNFLLPTVQAALAGGPQTGGGTVIDPDCDMFPTSITVWPHTAGVDDWLAVAGFHISAPDVAILPFNEADCLLTITVKGKTTTQPADPLAPHGVDRAIFVGEVADDPTVGPYFKVEASDSCLRPGAVLAMCRA